MQRNPVQWKEDRIVVWWAGLLPQEGCALSDITQKTVTKPQLGPQHLQLLGYTASISPCVLVGVTRLPKSCVNQGQRDGHAFNPRLHIVVISNTWCFSDHLEEFWKTPVTQTPVTKDSHSSALGWGLGSVIHFYKISPEGSTMQPLWWQSLTQDLVLDPSFTQELLR